jgi:hypothetical protein
LREFWDKKLKKKFFNIGKSRFKIQPKIVRKNTYKTPDKFACYTAEKYGDTTAYKRPVALPVALPVTLPMTLPVTMPVTLPVALLWHYP